MSELRELIIDPRMRAALKKIIEYEESEEERYRSDPNLAQLGFKPWWDWQDVGVNWRIIHKFVDAGVVKAHGGRRKNYLLVDREGLKKMIEECESLSEAGGDNVLVSEQGVPSDLFDAIEGYDDLKSFMKKVVSLDEPFHVLLVGPPGTAKSLFLMEVERLPGAKFVTAGTSTKAGIRELLVDDEPRFLLIDEIEKIEDPKDLSVLLTLMESQRIIVAKHGSRVEKRFPCSVIAACNTTRGLPRELLDRFQVFHLREYTREEFVRIVSNFLVKRRNVDPELARYIASRVSEYTLSVREAIRVAKVSKTKESVDETVELFKKYSKAR